jgi:rhodanese-related sulfurtransferase/CBS domain-containing protein
MPTDINRDDVQRLIASGAQLVEVLPAEEYNEAHLPGAINLPLKKLDRQSTKQFALTHPLIVYCNDFQWDLSARAAWRLESLGFSKVYRYVAGKLDWFAYGLSLEGEFARYPKASDVVRRDVPTCHLTDPIGEVYQRCQASGWKVCIVVNEVNVVLGRLRGEAWKAAPETLVEEVMENGPSTFRPDVFLATLVKRMQDKKVGSVVITNSDGVLIGVLYRKDAEERLHQDHLTKERAEQTD